MSSNKVWPSNATETPESSPESQGPESTVVSAQWVEARHAYPIYAALAKQSGATELPYPAGTSPAENPPPEIVQRDLLWLDTMDAQIKAFQIRQLPPSTLNANAEALRAFIQRSLRKPEKSGADRDKIDFLVVQYFALCAPESLYHDEVTSEAVTRVLKPLLGNIEVTPLAWCLPLESILEATRECHSLRDLLERGLLEQGRLLKESSETLFYDPAAMVTFARFNFLMRRAFIQLLHADQNAVVKAIDELERAGVHSVDCRRVGLSAAEPISQLRLFAENWRPLYHKDYSENAVSRSFEQLLALRTDLEEALAKLNAPPETPDGAETGLEAYDSQEAPQPAASVEPNVESGRESGDRASSPSIAASESPAVESAAERASEIPGSDAHVARAETPDPSSQQSSPSPVSVLGTSGSESCLDEIWKQLIASPQSGGRSMSTVVLKNTKVLLSSWEVAAFVTEKGLDAEDLRRAVVARAMISVAMDARKQTGEVAPLASALEKARTEVSYFHDRVDQAKRAKNTEGAVNLGISTKRLLSFIEEAEKLEP